MPDPNRDSDVRLAPESSRPQLGLISEVLFLKEEEGLNISAAIGRVAENRGKDVRWVRRIMKDFAELLEESIWSEKTKLWFDETD